MKKLLLLVFLACTLHGYSQTVKILFDATKAEMAGNADWVIDADQHNLGVSSSGAMMTGYGSESNPQRIPTAAQSGITSTTAETYWQGALSSWAIDLVRQGYTVETLPYNGRITYGVTTNAQDLMNYKVFIVDEPNIRFTSSEKTALLNFVRNGGGLFMISDHTISDRNGDGWDSPAIWNDFMSNNGSVSNPFGITFDLQNFSQTSYNLLASSTDPILHGSKGNVTGLQFNNGTSMTLNRTTNATVKGLIFKTYASTTGTTQAIFAAANYGNGKVCAIGDSSPMDDGTGDPNDALYSSYKTALSGSHQKLMMNAVIWLVTPGTAPRYENPEPALEVMSARNLDVRVYPNPANEELHVSFSTSAQILHFEVSDITGRKVYESNLEDARATSEQVIDISMFPSGLYFLKTNDGMENKVLRFIKN